MKFSESIRTCLSKYVTWQGRASRSEYWYFILFVFIVDVVAAVFDNALGMTFKITNPMSGEMQNTGYGYLYALAALALFLPGLSVTVRRLHDINRSGWWYWIMLVPLIGAILLLVWFCKRGTDGTNDYGPDPLAENLASLSG